MADTQTREARADRRWQTFVAAKHLSRRNEREARKAKAGEQPKRAPNHVQVACKAPDIRRELAMLQTGATVHH